MNKLDRVAKIKEMAARGLTRGAVAKEMGLSWSYIVHLAQRHKIQFVRHGNSIFDAPARVKEMIDLYVAGKTQTELSEHFGVSRQAISKRMLKYGCPTRPNMARQRKTKKKDLYALKKWGCTWDEYVHLRNLGTPLLRFYKQKTGAKERGILWQLTLWQWWTIWQKSGHWDERGSGNQGYVMCRYRDIGPYAEDNVYIATGLQNLRDYRESQRVFRAAFEHELLVSAWGG